MIKAEILAHSSNQFGNEIATVICTFPRIILAELNTHRIFSRNSASSRAIPFRKMLRSVIENPFIPLAFQKDHSGMQGTEYLDINEKHSFEEITIIIHNFLMKNFRNEKGEWDEDAHVISNTLHEHVLPILKTSKSMTIVEWWLKCRDLVVASAVLLHSFGTSKQICNRLLEPFMYHTCIVTATEWENFFALRCPRYNLYGKTEGTTNYEFRSRKDAMKACFDNKVVKQTDLEWLLCNNGQAEIHMMTLAEAMWDAYNESTPKLLEAGEWHIPYGDKIASVIEIAKGDLYPSDEDVYEMYDDESIISKIAVKTSTVMCARISYTTLDSEQSEWTIYKYVKKHDELKDADPKHMSPFEHCAKAMSKDEYYEHINGNDFFHAGESNGESILETVLTIDDKRIGWSGNFKGFIQYRKLIPNENITT